MTAEVVVITDDTTRADLIETLNILNTGAKLLRRKGYAGTASAAYALQHERINAILSDLQRTHA